MAVVVKHGVEPIGARIYASPIVTTTTATGTSDQQFSDSSDHKLCKWFCVKRTSNLLRIHILSNKKLQHFFYLIQDTQAFLRISLPINKRTNIQDKV